MVLLLLLSTTAELDVMLLLPLLIELIVVDVEVSVVEVMSDITAKYIGY